MLLEPDQPKVIQHQTAHNRRRHVHARKDTRSQLLSQQQTAHRSEDGDEATIHAHHGTCPKTLVPGRGSRRKAWSTSSTRRPVTYVQVATQTGCITCLFNCAFAAD